MVIYIYKKKENSTKQGLGNLENNLKPPHETPARNSRSCWRFDAFPSIVVNVPAKRYNEIVRKTSTSQFQKPHRNTSFRSPSQEKCSKN